MTYTCIFQIQYLSDTCEAANYQETSTNVVEAVFSRRMQCLVTLTGTGRGIVFKLKNSHLLAVMKDAVRKIHKTAKLPDIEKWIQKYLRHASDRSGGIPRAEKRQL